MNFVMRGKKGVLYYDWGVCNRELFMRMALDVFIIGFIVISIVILNEVINSYYRNYNRKHMYRRAALRAIELNRPLIVIGDPHNGLDARFHGSAYGCGSFIIDISGCGKNICEDVIERDVVASLNVFENNTCVIFISCVLEYLDDQSIEHALIEIARVSGERNNVFVVTMGSYSLSSYYYNYINNNKNRDVAKRIFHMVPPYGEFKYTNFSKMNEKGVKKI